MIRPVAARPGRRSDRRPVLPWRRSGRGLVLPWRRSGRRLVLPRRRARDHDGDAFDRRLYLPLVLGAVLNPVNSSMIAVALIPIGVAFGAPPDQTAWLVSGLYLATATGQPVVGRLVDLYGPRRLYLVGTALVGVAGALGLVAPSLAVLVAARVLLGFGTCAGYPAAMYLIRSEAERTGRASPSGVLTALTVSSQTIAVVGPTLGGLLIGLGGWRATFAVNIPLAVACLLLGARRLPNAPASPAPARPAAGEPDGQTAADAARGHRRTGLDPVGMALFAVVLTTLLLFLMNPRLPDLYLLGLCALALAGLVGWELRQGAPFLDLRVLAGNRPLLATYARNVFTYVVSYAFLFGYTQWLEAGRGLSATAAGLVLLPMFATGIVVSTTTGRRPEIRAKLVVGGSVLLVGCAVLLVVDANTPLWIIVGLSMVMGVPQGLNSLANQNAVYHQADAARMGSSAGLLRTFMYLGAIVAAAANGVFLGPGVDTAGLHDLGLFMTLAAVVPLSITLLDRSLRAVGRPAPDRDPSTTPGPSATPGPSTTPGPPATASVATPSGGRTAPP